MNKLKIYKHILFISFYILVFLFLTTCAPMKGPWEIREERIGKGFNLISKEDELEYSKQVVQKLEQDLEILNDPTSQRYIEQLGKRILKNSHLQHLIKGYDWSFKIVNSNEINAFATLGGKIYVNRGLIENVEKEEELAGAIAHEIGHVMGRHVSKEISKMALINAIIQAGVIISGEEGSKVLSSLFKIGGGVGAFFARLKFSRDDEREADYLAVQNMHDARFDPYGLISFFKRLKKIEEERGAPIWWLSTHPPIHERIEWISYHISKLPIADYYSDQRRFISIKNHIKRLPPPKKKEKKEKEKKLELEKVLNVPGNVAWFDTQIDLEDNQEIVIEALGEICLQKGNPKAWCSPEGLPIKTLQQPLPDENLGALIGKIGEESQDYFLIGSKNKIKVLKGGRLFLGVNEELISDNAGAFIVKIYVFK
ncbi:M48 family metallopeptidase [Candidatus Aminicenantes bacterium AC-335-K20]|nr:M48 family metallopeptidase [SCandidatus Aminicenantes bacterium Aminicenantia_JdfR_composite]MCP2597214.1 M48 family metallopeptidase [Candidatus Aminicenantes bacterium AC-335-G13]MCP2598483.1 M48 family metallopeptidase [Candidatus Aminicenantes bacterium AC-335-L06]MCP2618692.1 M48 family metallopeptidase [Candidatus Aminicenantes bacterium AC-335-A11]MCP2619523.1 M48 family metallopeptidase [Candidatus Aminicenantes bacterium AC-335-K20]